MYSFNLAVQYITGNFFPSLMTYRTHPMHGDVDIASGSSNNYSEGLGRYVAFISFRWVMALLNAAVDAGVHRNFSAEFMPPVAVSNGAITFAKVGR